MSKGDFYVLINGSQYQPVENLIIKSLFKEYNLAQGTSNVCKK